MAIDPRELRRVMTDIRSTVQEQPRDALVEILSYLFKEYVIEGPGPIGAGTSQVLDARSHLEGLPFAELITWLQQHVAAPELALFEVDGAQVSVRIRGQQTILEAPRTPVAEPVRAPVAAATPTPSVASSAPAPSVARVTSVSANARAIPAAEIATSLRNATAQPAAAPTGAATPSAPAAATPSSPASNDGQDRFSWLEVD